MEVIMPGGVQLSMDCEDMFKEITKKLYGEDGVIEFPAVERQTQHNITAHHNDYDSDGAALKPEEHITAYGLAALMQNGFPPPGILNANFMPRTNPNAEDKWTPSEETLQWSNSKIASYNPAQKLFKCVECECVGFLSRVAEHWLGTHSNARVFQCPQCSYGSTWARCVRAHLAREHDVPDDHNTEALFKNNPALDEITKYLQRLKTKIDGQTPKTPPPVQNTNTPQQQTTANNQQQTASQNENTATTKRYGCPVCPYATDRRDLFTRHENIHRDEKPFECYVCQKQFNRADHVKKHFLRMHRDHPYDLNRIRRPISKQTTFYVKPSPDSESVLNQPDYVRRSTSTTQKLEHQVKTETPTPPRQTGSSKKKGEKRYSCCYCSWSGVDNWCLKRHLNTHLKPFVCSLCDYKAARAERLTTHVNKVHNKKQCSKCSFLADDQSQLVAHQQEQHHIENRNLKVPNTLLRTTSYNTTSSTSAVAAAASSVTTAVPFGATAGITTGTIIEPMAALTRRRPQGAARLFSYMEASDGEEEVGDVRLTNRNTSTGLVQDFVNAEVYVAPTTFACQVARSI